MSKRIYLDHASLTPIDRRILGEMRKFSSDEYANPSSIYREGVAAKKAMESARSRVGAFMHAHADEVVFTSGGTEANNLAISGAIKCARMKGIAKPHLVISNIEHSSVMKMAAELERYGVEVTRLPVGPDGIISVDELKKAMKPNTVLVSIMTVNNEIGSVQPIREITKMIRAARKSMSDKNVVSYMTQPLFHTDAAQGALYEDLNVEQLGVDLLTLDGSKIYGPRGIGALFVRRGTPIEPIIFGGSQEKGMRSGTENIPAIMGFAKALDIATNEREKETKRMSQLKNYFLDGLKKLRPDIKVNLGQSPHILNVSIPGIDNEFFVLQLDAAGVAVSTKSSCLRDADESYVLKAIGADSHTAVRFSFGRGTTRRDLARTLKIIRNLAK